MKCPDCGEVLQRRIGVIVVEQEEWIAGGNDSVYSGDLMYCMKCDKKLVANISLEMLRAPYPKESKEDYLKDVSNKVDYWYECRIKKAE